MLLSWNIHGDGIIYFTLDLNQQTYTKGKGKKKLEMIERYLL
jgi:hypothetical protein